MTDKAEQYRALANAFSLGAGMSLAPSTVDEITGALRAAAADAERLKSLREKCEPLFRHSSKPPLCHRNDLFPVRFGDLCDLRDEAHKP